jgi:hypothetical protein
MLSDRLALLDDWFVQAMDIVTYGVGVIGVVVFESKRITFRNQFSNVIVADV